jgi:NAD(P)-dependent dehydrogenase (short-subunit alcohol dehydrogenase family)
VPGDNDLRTTAITGSGSGIGAATRRCLESSGGAVIGVDVHNAEVVADLSTLAGRSLAVKGILEKTGGRLDGLVLCAGIGPAQASAPEILSVNYYGAVSVLEGLREALVAGDAPAVVLISSNAATTVPGIPAAMVDALLTGEEGDARWAAETADPSHAYAASKLALTRYMRRIATSWAPDGVRINAVAPGAVQTPLLQAGLDDAVLRPLIEAVPLPLGHLGQPEQVASAIVFLLGDQSSFCCGSVLFVDGGTDAVMRPDGF